MSTTHRFNCGCEFEVVGAPIAQGAPPLLKFDAYNIRPNCKATWDLLSKGLTKGVFQLESPLGKQWTKNLKPQEMEHMAALGALLRPGPLRAELFEGMTMTKLYCQRVNREAPVTSFHPVIDQILAPTYGVLVYQESAMQIARDIAGFDLKEVDKLRKSVGKKDQVELAAVGELFLTKAKEKAIVPFDVAEAVWGWIKKSGRYAFNKAHSLSYGVIGYITAYIKAHFPIQFFWSWLRYAQEKSEPLVEIAELVNEAKLFDVAVMPPDIRSMKKRFWTDGVVVHFGLSDIKGIGVKQIVKLRENSAEVVSVLGKPIADWSWYETIVHFADHVSPSVMEKLICVGAFDHFGAGLRTRQLEEFRTWSFLTDKERIWIQERASEFTNVLDAVKAVSRPRKPAKPKASDIGPFGGCATEKRQKAVASRVLLLEHPPSPLDDMPNWVARTEAELLGVALTCSEVDALDQSDVNTTCKEYHSGSNGSFGCIILGVKIDSMRKVVCKRGKSAGREMAFLTVSDNSCSLADVTVFADTLEELKDVLVEGVCVVIRGERDKKKDSLIVKKANLM